MGRRNSNCAMTIQKSFFLFLGFCFTIGCSAQTNLLLRGKVVVDSLQDSSIHIINISQQTGTVNSASGSFEIKVKEKDTLWFTSVQYEKEEIIITAKILKERWLQVQLKEAVNELAVVNISNIKLTGNLEQDLEELPVFNKYNLGITLRTKPLPSIEERRLQTASSGPLALVINTLTGRIKQLKKEKDISHLVALVNKTLKILPALYYIEELKLEEHFIKDFLYYCAENAGLKAVVARNNELELMEFLKEIAPGYINLRKE